MIWDQGLGTLGDSESSSPNIDNLTGLTTINFFRWSIFEGSSFAVGVFKRSSSAPSETSHGEVAVISSGIPKLSHLWDQIYR
jgi:hypothetical protein